MPILTNSKEVIDLSDREFEAVQDLLHLVRHNEPWARRFISDLTYYLRKDEITPETIIGSLVNGIWNTLPDNVWFYGWLVANDEIDENMGRYPGRPMIELGAGDFTALMDYLEVRKANTWLSCFVAAECNLFAEHKMRTPRDVVRGLMNDVDQFDNHVDIAKDMLERYPKLFADQPVETSTRKEETTK